MEEQRNIDIAKRVLQWRWLIIDEISMVSAALLASVDLKLREVIREVGTQKVPHNAAARSLGGLNVLMCGDFWQLAPPDGGFLGKIPEEFILNSRKFKPAPTVAHGQSLVWGSPEIGLQGVTELVECERCDDLWLREVQEEFRNGSLSEDTVRFCMGNQQACQEVGKVARSRVAMWRANI